MAKASDNLYPYVHVVPAAAPTSPATGAERLFLDSADGNKLKRKNSAGTVTPIEGSGGSTAPAFVGCSVWRSAAWSAPNGGGTNVPFDAEDFDTDAFHDPATNPSRITIPAGLGGYYQLNGGIRYTYNGTGARAVDLLVNGSPVAGIGVGAAPVATTLSCGKPVPLNAGDYIELGPYQNSGGALALDFGSGGKHYTFLSAVKIG